MRSLRRNNARLVLLHLVGRSLSRPAPRQLRTERVLLIRPDHIGDVLLSAPAVALLRASLPDAQLSYLVGPWSAEAAVHGPAVNVVRTLAFPGFTRRRNRSLVAPYVLLVRQAVRLRRERYDLAVILRPDHWWGALLALVAGIPVRVGSETPETHALLTHARRPKPGEHAADQALGVARSALRAIGDVAHRAAPTTSFTIGDAARAMVARDLWSAHHLEGRRVVALHPSAGAPLKSWPTRNWATLADRLADLGLSVILVGAPDDSALLARIQGHMSQAPALSAFGQSLDISAAIYARCDLVVGLDSGATHLAAAVGTPTVRLFGPASANRFGPWPPRRDQHVLVARDLACVPCGDLESPPCGALSLPACLLALRVDDVLDAVQHHLRESRG